MVRQYDLWTSNKLWYNQVRKRGFYGPSYDDNAANSASYRKNYLNDGTFHSTVLTNFWLKIDWLWQEPLPKVLDVVREFGLLDK